MGQPSVTRNCTVLCWLAPALPRRSRALPRRRLRTPRRRLTTASLLLALALFWVVATRLGLPTAALTYTPRQHIGRHLLYGLVGFFLNTVVLRPFEVSDPQGLYQVRYGPRMSGSNTTTSYPAFQDLRARNASFTVGLVTPSASCNSTDSSASASGQPSNTQVATVRVGGSTSK